MKARMNLLPLLGLLALSAWIGLSSPENSAIVVVNDADAASVRGGAGCGSAWTSSTVNCNATAICNNVATACSSTTTQLTSVGSGTQVKDQTSSTTCSTCTSTTTCGGAVTFVSSTKPCITSSISTVPMAGTY